MGCQRGRPPYRKGEYAVLGWWGKILVVDLSDGSTWTQRVDDQVLCDYIGGRGLGIKFLYELVPASTDPLGPDNMLGFFTGPCTATSVPFSGIINVTCKSPLTGTALSAHVGGRFGVALKLTGFDGILIKGASVKPTYLLVDNGVVSIKEADDLWGLDVFSVTSRLEELYPGCSVAAIGPAGENLVRFASVMVDNFRAAGRGGAGAVMGAKRLKAVVVRSKKGVRMAQPDRVREELVRAIETIRSQAVAFRQQGTPIVVATANRAGILPTRNFSTGYFEQANEISGVTLVEKFKVRDRACYACPLGCSNITASEGVVTEGPEYETIYSFGSNCGNSDLGSIVQLNDLCDRLGLDTISAGCALAFAMELYERGVLGREDLDGEVLRWGDARAMKNLLSKIVYRRGIGDTLAEGTRLAASRLGAGAEKYAIHVKGLEPAGYEPRGVQGMALAYATSNRGACHLRAMTYVYEVFMGVVDRSTLDGKPKLVRDMQDLFAAIDSMLMCKFGARNAFNYSEDRLAHLLSAVTGVSFDGQRLLTCGERIWNLERLFNVREGLRRADDALPSRFCEPVPSGPTAGWLLDRARFEAALTEYYELRGWDDSGVPTEAKLVELGLPCEALGQAQRGELVK